MTIEEMHKAKREAEAQIAHALNRFMQTTGLMVEDVRLGFIDAASMSETAASRMVDSVTLDVRL